MQDFEISVQAAYVIYNQSAIVVIILAVSKKVSSLASDDQMAPPFGNLPPLKRWAKLFTFVLICADFFNWLIYCKALLRYHAANANRVWLKIYEKEIKYCRNLIRR
jgi:hypothetical protein